MRPTDTLDRQTSVKKLREFSHYWNTQISQWKAAGLSNVEKQYAQPFWTDFLACFGINASRIALFERRAQRANTKGAGFIDFFMPAMVIGEAKSLGRNLDKAQEQVDDYLAGGSINAAEFPKYSIVTNFETFQLRRLDDSVPDLEISITDIAEHYDAFLFLLGKETITKKEEEEASIHAAQLMADLYTSIMGEEADTPVGEDAPEDAEEEDLKSQETSILMTRLLFLLYGDDANLWEADLFYRWVDLETTPSTLGPQLNQLFSVLNTPENRRSKNIPELMAQFPYVNGSIFQDSIAAEFFTPETHEALLQACAFRWNRINVSVFGAMFQLVKSKEARRAAGEHYTSEKNILKTIGPLFLDAYRARADQLIANKGTKIKDINALLDEMAANIYCDPACGGGNFLNLAYAKLREVETDLLVERQKRGGELTASMDISFDQKLSINQFWGFEINWWPAKIAETAMFLVDHQANLKLAAALGDAPERLPIRITAHIVHANALRLDWENTLPETTGQTFIFGNPPFLGDHTRTKEQLQDLQDAWGTGFQLSRMDFVTGWHAKCLSFYKNRRGEFAFVTTNSITQGDQAARLFEPLFDAGWVVKFAHRTFTWDSEAPGKAAVHCVIVGFTRNREAKRLLWSYENWSGEAQLLEVKSKNINAYLIDGPNVLVQKRSKPLSTELPEVLYGSKPTDGGNFVLTPAEYETLKDDPIVSKYIRSFIGSAELVRGLKRWCLLLVDLTAQDLKASPELQRRIESVKEFRAASAAASTREYPHHHLFRQFGPVDQGDFVCIPRVVSEKREYFTVDHLPDGTVASDATFVALDPDKILFALISSSMFITWQKAVGGRLKSDLRFSSTLVWNTFPVPELSDKDKASIIAAGEKILEVRHSNPDMSLADLYNHYVMKPELRKAHENLDRAVDKAFGAPRRLTSEAQRLELLFKRYQELTR